VTGEIVGLVSHKGEGNIKVRAILTHQSFLSFLFSLSHTHKSDCDNVSCLYGDG
jgi:hypothetical protein